MDLLFITNLGWRAYSQVEHYALDSRLSFEKIEKSTALQQLQTYVEAYLFGQVSVSLMPMKNFDQYLQLLFTPKSNNERGKGY